MINLKLIKSLIIQWLDKIIFKLFFSIKKYECVLSQDGSGIGAALSAVTSPAYHSSYQ